MATHAPPARENSPIPDDNESRNPPVAGALADDTDVTKRRVFNDYSSYKPISIEPGKEQMRLLQIVPCENDEDELVCALFDAPAKSDEHIVYIALSYCWGDMTKQRTIGLIHHSVDEDETIKSESKIKELPGQETKFAVETDHKRTFNVTESLYQALKSLRKATPRLKEEFPILDHQPIWVDALCINQSDTLERNKQVGMMGTIYSRAFFVFIWLGEDEDIMRGLNLIQAMVNLLRDTWGSAFDWLNPADEHIKTLFGAKYKLDDELLDPESCFQILERLFSHPYFRRIWVLQEATINIQNTWIHVTKAQVPWLWIIVADRFRMLWRKVYYTAESGQLPIIWAELMRAHVNHYRESRKQGDESAAHGSSETRLLAPLCSLFIHTYDQFEASDLRDKLYALLDLSIEARDGTPLRKELAPDYSKSISEIFSNFTRWFIRLTGDLSILSLLAGGPRRLMPADAAKIRETDGQVPKSCLDARAHPSWAIWPTTGGFWTTTSLLKVGNLREAPFDLTSHRQLGFYDLTAHPIIKLPQEMAHRFVSLDGKRIGVVKSINRMPLRCFGSTDKDERSITRSHWATEEMQKAMEKHLKSYHLSLTDPYKLGGARLEGGLAPLWYVIQKETTSATIIGHEVVEELSQEWLGRKGGRYEGKDELMFRDFLETLLLSPIYRGEETLSWDGEGTPDGPWRDPIVATSFALFWAENDPEFVYPPPKIGQLLRTEMFERGIPRDKVFPFLFLGHGKCFFITEDERMGLCPPETQPGDIIVALYSSGVPFVVRPVNNETGPKGEDWTFGASQQLRDQLFRFIGECYVHERMTRAFFEDQGDKFGEDEIFNLC